MTMSTPVAPSFLPAATHSYLVRAAESLREAITASSVPERYAYAHVSALRATAALLAARARPVSAPRRMPIAGIGVHYRMVKSARRFAESRMRNGNTTTIVPSASPWPTG